MGGALDPVPDGRIKRSTHTSAGGLPDGMTDTALTKGSTGNAAGMKE